jgi:hypothetical protein
MKIRSLKYNIQIPDEKISLYDEFIQQANNVIRPLIDKFGFVLLPDTSTWSLEQKILALLEEYSPRSLYEIQRKLWRPATQISDALIDLIRQNRVIFFTYKKDRGRPGTWYGVRNAKNLQPYWEKFFQILSDGKIHERDVVLELVGVPIPSPEAKFLEWAVITYDNVVAEAGEYEGKFRFVYFLRGSEGEKEWNEKVKKVQAQQMGETPLGQGQMSDKKSPEEVK